MVFQPSAWLQHDITMTSLFALCFCACCKYTRYYISSGHMVAHLSSISSPQSLNNIPSPPAPFLSPISSISFHYLLSSLLFLSPFIDGRSSLTGEYCTFY